MHPHEINVNKWDKCFSQYQELQPTRLLRPWDFSRQEYWSGVPLPSPPYGASGKEPTCQSRRHKRHGYDPWVRKIPWRRKWQSTLICLPGKSHGQWRLAAIVHGVTKSQIWLKQLSMHTPTEMLLNIIQFHSKEWPGSKSQWCQG